MSCETPRDVNDMTFSCKMDSLNGLHQVVLLTVRKGTDFLYSRFRPGLLSTLAFLLLLISGMQYLFQSLTASRQRTHINRYIEEVKEIAWRPYNGNPPLNGAKKYVTLADQSEEGTGPSKRFAVDFVGSVYFVDPQTGEESLLDTGEIEGADWRKTLIYVLPTALWNTVAGRILKKNAEKGNVYDTKEHNENPHKGEENGKPNTTTKHSKVEKVAGKRKAKKRN